jgi:hypothetical protein
MAGSITARMPATICWPWGTTASSGGSKSTACRTTSGWRATRPQAVEAPPLWPTTTVGVRSRAPSSAAASSAISAMLVAVQPSGRGLRDMPRRS